MSADAWSVCPRCTARHDVGYKGNEFREDYSIYGAETGTVTVEYRGECQRCGLVLEFTSEHPIPDWQDPNKPTGFILRRTWATVPAGWFVQTPKGQWLEVGATHLQGDRQMVSIRVGDAFQAFPRDPDQEVKARRGTLAPRDRDDALNAIENAFKTAILSDEPPGQS